LAPTNFSIISFDLEYFLIFSIVTPCLFSIISSGLEQISSFFFLAPSRFSSFSYHLEQPSLISLLCSNHNSSSLSTLGATFPNQLALLQKRLPPNSDSLLSYNRHVHAQPPISITTR